MKIIFIMVPQCIYLYTWKEVVLVVDSVWGARTRGDPLATSPSMGEREGLMVSRARGGREWLVAEATTSGDSSLSASTLSRYGERCSSSSWLVHATGPLSSSK